HARDQLLGSQRGVILGGFGDLAALAARRTLVRRVRARAFHDVGDLLDDGLRRDAVFGVVVDLLLPAPVRLLDRALHRLCDAVGVEDRLAAQVARGAADRLDQRAG